MREQPKLDKHIRSAIQAANVALWSICPESGETWFSDTWYSMLGYEPGAFEPSFDTFMAMMHPDDREPTTAAYVALVEDRVETYAADFRLRAADGSWRWLGATGSKVERSGEERSYLIYGMQMDITERKTTEADLKEVALSAFESSKRLARLAQNSPAALFEFRIDEEGAVTLPYITAGVHQMLDVPASEIEGDGLAVFRNIFEEDMEKMGPAIEASRRDLSTFRIRYRVKRPDLEGGFIWVQANSAPHREEDGSTVWFGSVYDVTEEVRREHLISEAHDSMRYMALHDSLTALPNRRSFDAELLQRQSDGEPCDREAIVVRVDLDRFKYVNDTLGHAAGDAVLKHVADVLREALGPGDLAFRLGGDEFCVLMARGRVLADAECLVDQVQCLLADPFFYEGKPCRFGASFGVASSRQGSIANGDLMSFADAALYEAKASGRGRLVVFNASLHKSILSGRRLAAEIEAAIENQEFVPFFQPQIDARSGALIGVEVLARWRKEDGQIIAPDRFLPIAEQIRAVPLIDAQMVAGSAETVSQWQAAGLFVPKIAFNVSAGRLRDSSLVSSASALQAKGMTVAFELLESILLEDADSVVAFNLDSAREAGISIEIDDFGTGHASILGLTKIRPDVLKIDRRLTLQVEQSQQGRALVSSILAIAKALDVKTLAEGVETEKQAAILRDLGCDFLQGYLYSGPLGAEALLEWACAKGFSYKHASLWVNR